MDNLLSNLNKLHITEKGELRIRANIILKTNDVLEWCRKAIKNADVIFGIGKNWYVYSQGNVITINIKSFTIITVHKISGKLRIMQESDYICLKEFIYQAIYTPKEQEVPERSIIYQPEIYRYIDDFGTRTGDIGVVIEQNRQVVGAAWTRIISDYGYIDDNTPELAISILPEFRGYGMGTKLMKKLFKLLKQNGYYQTSLSVQKDNPAVRFYTRLGYKIMSERDDGIGHIDYLMLKKL